jgi:integrase/recombinase XerD
MRRLKHLPVDEWPEADREAFRAAYEPGNVFDETAGPGAHLAEGTRRLIETAYRRWLGFLNTNYLGDLSMAPADRITLARLRAFIDSLSIETGSTSVAIVVDNLCKAARLISPRSDWTWLHSLKSRLMFRARPKDRFDRLIPPCRTLDLGMELMDEALKLPITHHKQREIQYRDGLLLALLSLWPIRRRSIAALTISRHLEFDDAGVNILLHPSDTKAKRAESFRVPEPILPYLRQYLEAIRPRLLGRRNHDGLWASFRGQPLSGGQIYQIARSRTVQKFGKAMGLHDFRRAASTFVAMDAPEKIGLIPGILQHASPDVSDQHYNLSRSVEASRRFGTHLAKTRATLRPVQLKNKA